MIYFDNSATTPVLPEVADAMLPYLYEEFGNPSSKYYTLAENAHKAVETAREWVSRLIGCMPEEVIFTSGSTESNNMVIKGVAHQYRSKGNVIVTSEVEHPSVLETFRFLGSDGYDARYLKVDSYGRVDSNDVVAMLNSANVKPILLSIIWGNNELGSLNDIPRIAQLCKDHEVFFHTDATQVVGKVKVAPLHPGVTFLSMSAHKIHGPKGIGACVIRKHPLGFKTKVTPLLHGGGQENEYRSGTLSVHNIVGFGKAAEITLRDLEQSMKHLSNLEEHLLRGLQDKLGERVHFNSDTQNKIPGVINIEFKGINNELLIKSLANSIAVSTGSACSSTKPSHVLQSIGLTHDQIRSSIRISLSGSNTIDEIEQFLALL